MLPWIYHSRTDLDPLSHWPYAHHRSPKNCHLLRSKTEAERHGRVCDWYTPYTLTVASDRISRGTLRHTYPFWRLLRDNWFLCGQYPGGRTLSPTSTGEGERGAEKCRTAGLITKSRGNMVPDEEHHWIEMLLSSWDRDYLLKVDHMPATGKTLSLEHMLGLRAQYEDLQNSDQVFTECT